MEQSNITNFVKRELIKKRNWQIDSIILNGTDGREYTYSVPSKDLYVMLPDEDMVNETIKEIKEVLSN